MNIKYYLDKAGVTQLIDEIKSRFAPLSHTHKLSELSDYKVDTSLSSTSTNPVENKIVNAALNTKVPISRTINGKELSTNITITASDIGSVQTDTFVEHVDNTDIHFTSVEKEKLNNIAAGAEVNVQSDWSVTSTTSDAYIKNKPTSLPANGGNSDTVNWHTVESNVPADAKFTDTTYGVATSDNLGLVRSGTDITVDSSGNVSIKDDSHNHVISNIDNLQSSLDAKVPTTRTINGKALSANITLSASDVGADVSGSASEVQMNLNTVSDKLDDHVDNLDIHFTSAEREKLSGIETGANKYTHPTSGVSAGTYKSVTVDANGHITKGTNPTTLSGYGITDAEAKGTTSTHNSSTSAHSDIRNLITELSTKVNNFLDVTDTTKDELSEVIALIEGNSDLIEGITTGKVNVSDIVNNLTTNSSSKPLSAEQGVVIKSLIDTLQSEVDGKSDSGHTHNYAGSSSAGGAATSANKLNTNAGSTTHPVYFSNGVPVKTTYTLEKSVPSNAVFTDTHYSSKNVVGASTATSNTGSALANGNVYLNSVENGAVTSSHKISGSGATTVTTDTNGNIVISSTDNNTTYDAAGSSLGLVKSGGDVTISSGVITVNDDSHNHTISNIDNLQSTLDGKQATITGAATTLTSSNLTASRALISNASGKVEVSAVTSTELGYLDGVTSNVQTQLDSKSSTGHTHSVATTSAAGFMSASDKTKLNDVPSIVEVTQAEYNALGSAVNSNDTLYFITDAGIDGTARNVDFDNAASGLNAVNVQDAIDEIKSNMGNQIQIVSSAPLVPLDGVMYAIVSS